VKLSLSIVAMLVIGHTAGMPQEPGEIAKARILLREASTLVPQIEELERPIAAANIAGEQAQVGDLTGALETAKLVKESERAGVMGSIAYALAGHGNLPVGLQLLKDSADGQSKAVAYLGVAQELAEKKNFEGALTTVRLIRSSDQTSTFVDGLMRVYSEQWKAGAHTAAAKTLEEALSVAERLRSDSTQLEGVAAMYHTIVRYAAIAGDRSDAYAIVGRLWLLAGEQENRELQQRILAEVASALAEVGEFSEATHTARMLVDVGSRDNALHQIAMEQAGAGDAADALSIAQSLTEGSLRNVSLYKIANAFVLSGDYAGALAVMDGLPAGMERAFGLADLALEQAKRGDPAAAQTVALSEEATEGAHGQVDANVYEFNSVTRAILGDFVPALLAISNMDEKSKVWPLWNVAGMLAEAGKEHEALALAESQNAPEPRAYALLSIASAIIRRAEAAVRK